MSIKILLDRSIFHEEGFRKLKQSKILDLSRLNILSIYGNPQLFDETLRLWFSDKKSLMIEHLNFIYSVTNGRYFDERQDIWKKELDFINRQNKYYFMERNEEMTLKKNIRDILQGKGGYSKEQEDQLEKWLNQKIEKSTNTREILKKMRTHVSDELEKQNKKRKDIKETLDDYFSKVSDWTGEEILKSILPEILKNTHLVEKWKANKTQYPYFTAWLKSFLFISYQAMSDASARIDLNADGDINQVSIMLDIDILVSDEKHFMKDVFDQLFKNTPKKYMNSEEFIYFINNNYD
jgi:hypothetical protein